MNSANKISMFVLLLPIVTSIPLTLPANAMGAQYRESDFEFVSKLTTRLDVAEVKTAELEGELDEISARQTRQSSLAARTTVPESTQTVSTGAATEPQKVDGAYVRVPERLKHKNRAAEADPDDIGRIKAKFPLLREDITKARKNLLGHELTHAAQGKGRDISQQGLASVDRSISDIEKEIANLAKEVKAAEKARAWKEPSR
jgi:hypothetical protein